MPPVGWTHLVLLALVAASYGVRRVSPSAHFFHTPGGAQLLAALTGLLAAVTQAVQAHGLDWKLIYAAGIGYLMSLLATSNPSTPIGELPAMAPTDAPKPPAVPISRVSVLVPVLFLLGLSSCAWFQKHPQASAALDCVAKDVAESAPTLVGDAGQALMGGAPDWGTLAKLEGAYGVDAVVCAVEALTSPKRAAAVNPRVHVNAGAYLRDRGVIR